MSVFCAKNQRLSQDRETRAGQLTSIVSGALNGVMAVVKICGGFMTGSTALIADGVHSASDLASDAVAYFSFSLARAKPDDEHQYGHHKFESLGLLILASLLALASLGILQHAISALIVGGGVQLNPLAAVLALISVAVNEGLFWYCYLVGKRLNSSVIIANAWHHRLDGISSLIVLVGVGLNTFGLLFLDNIAAIIVGLLLLKMAFDMVRKAIAELVDTAASESTQKAVEEIIRTSPGVRGMHILRTKVTGGQLSLDAHVEVLPEISVSEGHAISDEIERRLKLAYSNLADVMIHIDPYADEDMSLISPPRRAEIEKTIQQTLRAHAANATVERLVLHALPRVYKAEIVLSGLSRSAAKKLYSPLAQVLKKPAGELDEFTLQVLVEKET